MTKHLNQLRLALCWQTYDV